MKLQVSGLQSEFDTDNDIIENFNLYLDSLKIVKEGTLLIDSDTIENTSETVINISFSTEELAKFAYQALTSV